jgi:RimJ/RimL family protein N-acetyltransferase
VAVSFELITNHSAGHWTAGQTKGKYFEANSQSIGLKQNGEFVAGVIYENWNRRTITCHIAIAGRMTPRYLAIIFDYPFNVCDVKKIIVPVDSTNLKSINLVEKMGFTEEARIKDGMADGDMILYTLAKNDCKYLGERYERLTVTTTST